MICFINQSIPNDASTTTQNKTNHPPKHHKVFFLSFYCSIIVSFAYMILTKVSTAWKVKSHLLSWTAIFLSSQLLFIRGTFADSLPPVCVFFFLLFSPPSPFCWSAYYWVQEPQFTLSHWIFHITSTSPVSIYSMKRWKQTHAAARV